MQSQHTSKGPNDQTMESKKPKQEKQKQTSTWSNFFKSCSCGSSPDDTDELANFAAYQAMTDDVKKDNHSGKHDNNDCCGLSSGDSNHDNSDPHHHHHGDSSHHDHGSADHGSDSHDGGGHDWGGDYDGGFDHGW